MRTWILLAIAIVTGCKSSDARPPPAPSAKPAEPPCLPIPPTARDTAGDLDRDGVRDAIVETDGGAELWFRRGSCGLQVGSIPVDDEQELVVRTSRTNNVTNVAVVGVGVVRLYWFDGTRYVPDDDFEHPGWPGVVLLGLGHGDRDLAAAMLADTVFIASCETERTTRSIATEWIDAALLRWPARRICDRSCCTFEPSGDDVERAGDAGSIVTGLCHVDGKVTSIETACWGDGA